MRKSSDEKDTKTKQMEMELEASQKKIKHMEEKLRETIKKYDDLV